MRQNRILLASLLLAPLAFAHPEGGPIVQCKPSSSGHDSFGIALASPNAGESHGDVDTGRAT